MGTAASSSSVVAVACARMLGDMQQIQAATRPPVREALKLRAAMYTPSAVYTHAT